MPTFATASSTVSTSKVFIGNLWLETDKALIVMNQLFQIHMPAAELALNLHWWSILHHSNDERSNDKVDVHGLGLGGMGGLISALHGESSSSNLNLGTCSRILRSTRLANLLVTLCQDVAISIIC